MVHRTVRWCTGLSGEPTAASATVDRAIRGRRVARANGRQGAPDCPVRQQARSCNGRLRQKRKEIGTGPSTVTIRWHTRLSGVPHSPWLVMVGFARNGRKSLTIHFLVVHRTVRCAHGQKATRALQMELKRLLAALGL